MRASDIMTSDVCTVGPDTPLTEVARRLVERRISAVVVVDEGGVVGIVSEGDLMRRQETQTEHHRSWWLRLFVDNDTLAHEYVQSHGLTARDVMTRHVFGVHADTPLAEVADVLEKHAIKRVPVVDNGKLVGLVSRGDLVRAFLHKRQDSDTAAQRSDGEIRTELEARMKRESWADTIYVNSVVHDGVVELSGLIQSEDQRQGLRVLAETIPGVKRVEDNLRFRTRFHGA